MRGHSRTFPRTPTRPIRITPSNIERGFPCAHISVASPHGPRQCPCFKALHPPRLFKSIFPTTRQILPTKPTDRATKRHFLPPAHPIRAKRSHAQKLQSLTPRLQPADPPPPHPFQTKPTPRAAARRTTPARANAPHPPLRPPGFPNKPNPPRDAAPARQTKPRVKKSHPRLNTPPRAG
jgi:hypothetical protein